MALVPRTGFVGDRDQSRTEARTNEYAGQQIIVVDNTDVRCRDRSCITDLPQVFETCDPNAANPAEIIKTIRVSIRGLDIQDWRKAL